MVNTRWLVVTATLLPSLAHAHMGNGADASFIQGWLHPFSGIDHVGAMVAVGLWAAQLGGRSIWAVPLTFVSVMAFGSILPKIGISLPLAELGIALSVLLLGGLVAAWVRLPLLVSAGLVGLFALYHGHVHGIEVQLVTTGYLAGFMVATAGLHAMGIVMALAMQRFVGPHRRIVQWVGAAIALCGGYLMIWAA